MARISKEQRLADIHAEAMTQFDRIQSALRQERLQCLDDRRFYSIAGAQWEGSLGAQFENKPRFEVNKVHLAVLRIINEYRNNRISAAFISKDGTEYDKLADTCADLFRADEQDSVATEAYDTAFEEAVGGGFGAFRLHTEYENEEDDDDEKQRIRIAPIFDADSSVFFDLDAKRQDKADAKHCFVITSQSRAAYMEEWGDDPSSWPKDIKRSEFDWLTPDVVYVAEYYRLERENQTIRVFRHLDGSEVKHPEADFEDDEELEATLAALGAREVRQKKIKRRRVRKYILSGNAVLEDCGLIAGKHIPIVPVYGKRWFVDNVERCMGAVRLAKDAQRLKNMQVSKLGEIAALSSVEKPILFPEQVAGHQQLWETDNIKNFPYLLINPVTDATGQQQNLPPVAYTKAPNIPPALAAVLQVTEMDIKEILGNQGEADKMVSNISGKAVEMIQQRLDMQSFIYMSNFAKAVKRGGEIWLGMAKEVYVEEGRTMKGMGEQGEVTSIELMKPMLRDGMQETDNDLSEADFDVAVTVGPTSDSKRAATVRALTGMLAITSDPETAKVLQAMTMMNMEGEGISEVREYFRKQLVNMGVLKPTEEEAQELAQAQQQAQEPTPEQRYLLSQAEKTLAEVEKIKAEAQKLATEYDPSTVQMERDFEERKMAMENEKERMKLEVARLQSEVAQVKALSELEGERERTRATIEAPRREGGSVAPMIVVDRDGKMADVIQPTVEAMTMALAQTSEALEALSETQSSLLQEMVAMKGAANRPRNTRLKVVKLPDGSYEGMREDD
ncbi:Phage P22-like portal protein [uncultured Caudovirales phage]|uniref:Phage P22-like portal protein n=1 Tax=uncultured Caudovirales phage TaxID=2100421 RepID=A0A6J5NFF4_9CAUD|nr:Phage P22-like portal protein [uncultured Caudovirales phage]